MGTIANNKTIADLLTVWTEFEDYWYNKRIIGQYKDEPIEPTITDFMGWVTEQL